MAARFVILGFIVFCFSLINCAKHNDVLQGQVSSAGWVSSGGEFFQYGKNPWFLRNINEVSYCVRVDNLGFSSDVTKVRDAIVEAFKYWREQLKVDKNEAGMATVATQSFVEVEDCANADLQFLMGYRALNTEQIRFLVDPRKYIGVTVRTEYDQVKLKGRGFVFISSDTGSEAYHNSGQLIQKAWSYPKLLRYALMHELGHVFGLTHSGSGLMSEIFLDQLLYKRLFAFYLKQPMLSYVAPPTSFEACSGLGVFNSKFFRLKKPAECLHFAKTESVTPAWKVFLREKKDSSLQEIGLLQTTWATARDQSAKPAFIVHLPPEQKVFDATETLLNNYMMGPVIRDHSYKGFFRTLESAAVYEVYVDLKVDSVSVIGNLEDGLFPVFVYSVPTLSNMTMPTAVQ